MKNKIFRGFFSAIFVFFALFSGSQPPASPANPIESWLVNVIVKALGCENTSSGDKTGSVPEPKYDQEVSQGDKDYAKGDYKDAIKHYDEAIQLGSENAGSISKTLPPIFVKQAKAYEHLGNTIPVVITKKEKENLMKAGESWSLAAQLSVGKNKVDYLLNAIENYHDAGDNNNACIHLSSVQAYSNGTDRYKKDRIQELNTRYRCAGN